MTERLTHHERVRRIFEQALASSPDDRASYLAQACADEAALLRDVQQLLAAHAAAGSFLSTPANRPQVLDAAPSLSPGARLGAYDVVAVIGAGGMGEVYKARDPRLNRDVAIKILSSSFTQDPERLARFRREAQLLAALNHSHIGAIYDLADAGGVQYLVLEFVDGESLDRRIDRGPLSTSDALEIAKQIAEALAAAHGKGIIHRDLKPANVALTTDGQVKVLDFGLGKATGTSSETSVNVANSPTITSPALYAAPTGAGVLLGTAAYMSPEQARGKPADARSDIWAFGCVLYEMLTGKRAFDGEAIGDVLGAVTRLEPDWSLLPADVTTPVRVLLESCLVKDVRRRLPDIRTASFVLDNRAKLTDSAASETPSRIERMRDLPTMMRRRVVLTGIIGLAVVAALSGGLVWWWTRSAPPRVVRAVIPAAGSAALSIGALANPDRDVAMTPDGKQLVYIGNNGKELFVRPLDQLEPATLVAVSAQGSGAGVLRGVFTSPDGRWVGYVDTTTSTLKKVPIAGGPPVTVATMADASRGAAWLADDTIVFATNSPVIGLQRVSVAGGSPTLLTKPSRERGEASHLWPQPLPGGQAVLFTIFPTSGDLDGAEVAVLDLTTGAQRILMHGGSDARYVPSGHLVYAAAGTLRAVPFDLARLAIRGAPVPVVPSIATTVEGGADVATALAGTLVYVNPPAGWTPAANVLAWVDREGNQQLLNTPPHWYIHPRLSRDGTRVAVTRNDPPSRGIWILDLKRMTPTRLTSGPGTDHFPVWTSDDRRIVFASSRASAASNLYWQSADGTGPAERLTESTNTQHPTGVTPDGAQVLFTEYTSTSGRDVMLLTLTPPRRVIPLLHSPFNEMNGVVSPDGRWLAYQSDSSARYEVYVRPFPNVDAGQWQVSTDGGGQPSWSRDGRELFYRGDGALMAVTVTAQADRWSAGLPISVEKTGVGLASVGFGRPYDVSADGRQFLVIKAASGDATVPPQIVVVTHWDEELKRLVPR